MQHSIHGYSVSTKFLISCRRFVQKIQRVDTKMAETKIHVFKVEMTCEGCSGAVQRVLGKLQGNGVEKVEIDLPNKIVNVSSTLPAEDILEVIKKTGKQTEYVSSS